VAQLSTRPKEKENNILGMLTKSLPKIFERLGLQQSSLQKAFFEPSGQMQLIGTVARMRNPLPSPNRATLPLSAGKKIIKPEQN